MQRVVHLRFFYSFFFLCIFGSMWPQNIDSLRRSSSVEGYLKLGIELANKFGYSDSLYYYSLKAIDLSKAKKDGAAEQRALLNLAIYFQKVNKFDTSLIILRSIREPALAADVHFNMGLNFFRKNENAEAQAYYLKAINQYSEQKNYDGLALCFTRLAGLFVNEGQSNEAIDYGNKAFRQLDKATDPYTKLTVLSGLAGLYVQVSISQKEYGDSAIIYSERALELVERYGYYNKWSQLSNSLCNIYYLKANYAKALTYGLQSLKFKKYLFPNEILISYLNLSDCYNALEDQKTSLKYLDSVKTVLNSINDPYYRMSLYERIYSYNKEDGNYPLALEGLERFKSIQDSLFNVDKTTVINDLEQKYNKFENEKKISELNKENEISSLNVRILIIGIIAAILAIAVIVFINRQIALKNKFKILETEQRLNRARMDPHFFFNALSSLQTLAIDKENNEKVVQLISKFSKVMRQSLESSYNELVTIERELEFLDNYLEVQKIRFPDKFDHKITCDDNLELSELKIPSMLLQPFLENSIEHGFKNIGYKGMITISIIKKESNVLVQITDNGLGFDTEKMKKEYPSRATQIITDRIELLNQSHGSKASFSITKNHPKGVCVEVTLPCIY